MLQNDELHIYCLIFWRGTVNPTWQRARRQKLQTPLRKAQEKGTPNFPVDSSDIGNLELGFVASLEAISNGGKPSVYFRFWQHIVSAWFSLPPCTCCANTYRCTRQEMKALGTAHLISSKPQNSISQTATPREEKERVGTFPPTNIGPFLAPALLSSLLTSLVRYLKKAGEMQENHTISLPYSLMPP